MKDLIYDQETGECVAFVLNGEVFRVTNEGENIATIRAGNIYDFDGNLIGHRQGDHVTGLHESTMPVSFKNLLGK